MKGVFLVSKHVLAKAMLPAWQDVIVNIGSIAGKDRRVYCGADMGGVTSDYAASKREHRHDTRDGLHLG